MPRPRKDAQEGQNQETQNQENRNENVATNEEYSDPVLAADSNSPARINEGYKPGEGEVKYPPTGGLPDTGPHSKYQTGVENQTAEVERARQEFEQKRQEITSGPNASSEEQEDQGLPAATREEMKAGKQALDRQSSK